MGDCGLILWENEALPLISSFRPVPDQKTPEIYRSEGFARAAYFIPGCVGAGVGQDSEILPAPSLLESQQPPKRHILGDG